MSMHAFALVRVSTSEQDTYSQRNSLRKIANDFGYEIDDEDIFEEKISGYDEDDSIDRVSILKLEEQILIRKPDAVFVWELSRLTRRAIKVQRYIDRLSVAPKVPMYFADYKVWTLDRNTLKPLDDNIMKLVGGAQGVELELERIKARTSRGRNAKAEQGFFVGHLADGYIWEYQNGEKVIKRDEERATLIESIFRMYVEKEYSTGMIRDVLNADKDKYPTTNRYRLAHPEQFRGYKHEYKDRTGNIYSRDDLLWADSSIAQILRDEWYKGIRYYNGKPYSVPAIVNQELWDKAQERLTVSRCISHRAQRKYLLAGKVYCGICGRKMYGHGDGYYNEYYCSSNEFGKQHKCGLRAIRQENLDSIVFNIMKARASEDITMGHDTVFSDFFKTDSKKGKEIDNEIKTHKRIIKRCESEIKEWDNKIKFYIQQQSKYINNDRMIAHYDEQILGCQRAIEKEKNNIQTHSIAIDKLKKRKKALLSIADKLTKVSTLTDFDNMRDMLCSLLSRIVIYNPDKTSSVIKIDYVNGESDIALYNPTRLSRRFVFLSQDYRNRLKICYDDVRKVISFDGYYLGVMPGRELLFNEEEDDLSHLEVTDGGIRIPWGMWDTPQNRASYEEHIKEAIASGQIPESKYGELMNYYEIAIQQGIIWKDVNHAIECLIEDGYKVFKDYIPVIDYINLKREPHSLQVYGYNDLLPMTEEGIKRRNYQREYYRKKYNTGKPTFTEFIEKGADYDRINKERKHLYNRKYKILNNKHLTEEQKEEKIMKIMEQLEAFKYQLKYLPSNKKGVLNIKKYNTPKEV